MKILIDREGKNLEFTLTPKIGQGYNDFGQIVEKPQLGVSPNGTSTLVKHQGLESFKYAIQESFQASTLIIKGIIKLISGEVEAKKFRRYYHHD